MTRNLPNPPSRRNFIKTVLLLLSPLLLLVTLFAPAYGQVWSGVLSASRGADWSAAGVPGGIPSGSWTQCGATIAAYGSSGSPASPATIQNAISACGTDQYVQLGAGSFYLSGSIYVKSHSNMEIRGMGANSTFIYFYGMTGVNGDNCQGLYALICFESQDTNYDGTQSNGPVSWTAGYARGTTVITLASVPNLKIGNPIILDQLLDTSDTGAYLEQDATSGGKAFTSPGSPGPYSAQGGDVRPGRGLTHVYVVAGCNGSTTIGTACSGTNVAVTLNEPIEETNWNSALSPQAWWATSPIENAGVQNLAIDATNSGCSQGNGIAVGFFNAAYVWERGVRSFNECRTHTTLNYVTHATIRDSYWFLSRYAVSQSYGFECFASSDSLIENNIIQAIAGAIVLNEGCVGNVVGYNFEIMGFFQSPNFVIPMQNWHGVGNDLNLSEGNIGSTLDADSIHGTGNDNTLFRNRMAGLNPTCWVSGPTNNDYASYLASTWGTCTQNVQAIEDDSFHRFFNVIGNVLGTAGSMGGYQNTSAPIYNVGYGYYGSAVPTDSAVTQTLYRWGNCDAVHGFSAASCLWNSSEVPVSSILAASQLTYVLTVPSSHTLPASFYYASQPSWWPASKPWPIIGPDVTGGNISGTGGLAYTNPAEDCYNSLSGSTSNGTGGPFPFDADTCYGSGAMSSGNPPAAPTNLSAVVE